MSRISAAEMKGTWSRGHNDKPREGTKLRGTYDHLMSKPGHIVKFSSSDNLTRCHVTTLRDFYLLDIRHVSKGEYVLAGKWEGDKYIDYVAQRFQG